MLYARQLTPKEHDKLRCMTQQKIGRVGHRAHMVLLSSQRRPVPEIAAIFEVCQATVRYWIHRFNAAGLAGLQTGLARERPTR